MRLVWSNDWRVFFGPVPYPFDLTQVEARDGADRECQFLRRTFGPPPRILLDLGCGYGRIAARLAGDGYSVAGTDASPECIARATARPGRHRAVVAVNEHLPFAAEAFDGVYSIYSSVGYAGTSTESTLTEAFRVVKPGGLLVIDVKHERHSGISAGCEKVPAGGAVWIRLTGKSWSSQHNLVAARHVAGHYGIKRERNTINSLTRHVVNAGWVVRDVFSDYDGAPFSARGPRLVMVACRPS